MSPQPAADIGLIGLAVMGQNLVLNLADHGYSVAVYNRTRATGETFARDFAIPAVYDDPDELLKTKGE